MPKSGCIIGAAIGVTSFFIWLKKFKIYQKIFFEEAFRRKLLRKHQNSVNFLRVKNFVLKSFDGVTIRGKGKCDGVKNQLEFFTIHECYCSKKNKENQRKTSYCSIFC